MSQNYFLCVLKQNMRISTIPNINPVSDNHTFKGRGKPIGLEYIMKNRSYALPPRVHAEVTRVMAGDSKVYPSLLDIHKKVYSSLLECKTLEEAKKLYPEFSAIKEKVEFARDSVYSKRFYTNTDENFSLTVLKRLWGDFANKEDVAKEFNMKNRTSLDWALKQIDLTDCPSSVYKKILCASDSEGNSLIASKTTAWNSLHPDLMKAHNRSAAQACKKKEYRIAQAARIKEYDSKNPQRREKISKYAKRVWELCPEVRVAMAKFAENCPNSYIKTCVMKRFNGQVLTEEEARSCKSFFQKFWNSNPNLKTAYARARAVASMELRSNKLS